MGKTASLVKILSGVKNCEWIYRIWANPGRPWDGIVPPAPVLAPGSAPHRSSRICRQMGDIGMISRNIAACKTKAINVRLKNRLKILLGSMSRKPSLKFPAGCNGRAEMDAAYGFLDHEHVTFSSISAPHRGATIERIREQPVVLIPQDTTELDVTRPDEVMLGSGPLNDSARVGFYVKETSTSIFWKGGQSREFARRRSSFEPVRIAPWQPQTSPCPQNRSEMTCNSSAHVGSPSCRGASRRAVGCQRTVRSATNDEGATLGFASECWINSDRDVQ